MSFRAADEIISIIHYSINNSCLVYKTTIKNPNPKVISSNFLFCPQPKDIQFTIIDD